VVLLLAAMHEELAGILPELESVECEERRGFELYRGDAGGRRLAVARVGVGKVLAASVTQDLIGFLSPSAVVLSGTAGALRPELPIGEVVIARDCLQHDLDATALGFARGAVPCEGVQTVECDEGLNAAAYEALRTVRPRRFGRVLTGDRFLTAREKQELAADTELCGTVVDMESAAVAQVCALESVPLLVLRTVSDTLDGRRPRSLARLLRGLGGTTLRCYRRAAELGLLT